MIISEICLTVFMDLQIVLTCDSPIDHVIYSTAGGFRTGRRPLGGEWKSIHHRTALKGCGMGYNTSQTTKAAATALRTLTPYWLKS